MPQEKKLDSHPVTALNAVRHQINILEHALFKSDMVKSSYRPKITLQLYTTIGKI